ncbi:MAG TPA: hypothetical protein VJB88_01215 [Vicinamibacteria bacterium]|nr:hypothetical protein [Vicinamibacteria bacterium]
MGNRLADQLCWNPFWRGRTAGRLLYGRAHRPTSRGIVAGGGVLWELPGFLTPVWNVSIRFGYGVNLEPLPQESRDRFFLSLSLRF